jgi:arylsulfatase A-like enzyme
MAKVVFRSPPLKMNNSVKRVFLLFAVFSLCIVHSTLCFANKPNIIFVLADDLARGDVGAYGQKLIQTPNIDQLAKEGVRFTQGYSGTAVCAPSRGSFITGRHTGHSPIRANRPTPPEGQKPLPEGTYTVAKQLKAAGYATLAAGKWGLGMFDTAGSPLKNGFDNFYGYNCQSHAHSYFPAYLYEDAQRIELDGKTYSQDLIIDYSLNWIRKHSKEPFFFFYAATLPHGKYEIDDLGIYKDKDWTDQQKNYAAMVSRLDTHVGQILNTLKELNIDDNTLVIFAGDNGSAFAPDNPLNLHFNSNGELRGFKRGLYEGGIRQAFLARWKGHIKENTDNDTPVAFWDLLPTFAELSGSKIPDGVQADGVSIVPALLHNKPLNRDTLYWELHEGKTPLQAARWMDWKFVKNGPKKAIELYDLKTDIGEQNNVAAEHPDIIKKGERLLKELRVDTPDWHIPAEIQ